MSAKMSMEHIKQKILIICLVCGAGLVLLFLGSNGPEETKVPEESAASVKKHNAYDINLVPHKALYEIKMVSRHTGSKVLNISGQMFYEWQKECDAWTTGHQFKLAYEYTDSAPMKVTSDFSTYETNDGKSFNFNARRMRNGTLFEEIRGFARNDDGKFHAEHTRPDDLTFDLSKEVMFPMQHTIELLEHIHQNKTFFTATVFDGSDDEGPVEISAFIGKPANALSVIKPSEEIDTTLINSPAWNIRMAFFPVYNDTPDSDYEMKIIFHDNGVISDMLVDYRDFSVTQKLVALERTEEKNDKNSTCR